MCIWNVREGERQCEYCSYYGGCEAREMCLKEPPAMATQKYISVMDSVLGDSTLSKTKASRYVWARKMIAYKLRERGYTFESIGRALGKNHSTVVSAVNSVRDMLAHPLMYGDETIIWDQFVKNLKICGIES